MHGRVLDSRLHPTNLPYHIPLSSGDGIMAVCLATRISKFCLPLVGDSILSQLCLVADLRYLIVCHPCSNDKVAESVEKKEDPALVCPLSRSAVSCSKYPMAIMPALGSIPDHYCTFQCHHHLLRSNLPRCERPMGHGRLLVLRSHARDRDLRNWRHSYRAFGARVETTIWLLVCPH